MAPRYILVCMRNHPSVIETGDQWLIVDTRASTPKITGFVNEVAYIYYKRREALQQLNKLNNAFYKEMATPKS